MTDRVATTQRWQQIEDLFFAAAAVPETERSAFLHTACAGDSDLCREIESLFSAETGPNRGIETLIESAATFLFNDNGMEGARFGAYRIVREIGRGGMGAVYLAARADQEFNKQVAIKLVKRGIDTDAVLKRFRQERQILAVLDHPNIARLLDGGTTPDGLPYFVLEYVEGRPIHLWCQERHLNVAGRCELFRKVCDAVSFAHRNLVIHRDLKPANILVTADGEPKLLDFGIARLLTRQPSGPDETTLPLTVEPVRALTPAYASPEQVRGEPVNTATDVYSLGAVLFEMLTGTILNPGGAPYRKTLHTKTLDDDLNNIIAMATRPEPERRYQSVDQLGEDVRRYLTGLPVLAREDTWTYRVGKFLQRNRVAASVGTVFAALVIGGVISVAWEAHEAEVQRRRAEQRLGQMVELANRTLFNVHGSIEHLPGATGVRHEIVQTTLEYLDKLYTESGSDPRVLSALAPAYIRLARIEGDPLQPNLGDLHASEESYRKAGRILESLLAASPGNPDLELQFADYSEDMGRLLEATTGPRAAAEAYRRGVVEIDHLLERDPRNFQALKTRAILYNGMDRQTAQFEPSSAKRDTIDQLESNRKLVASHPEDPDILDALSQNYSQLGALAGGEGKTRESIQYYQKSSALREQILGLHPNDVAAQRELMMSYGHIGDMLGSPFLLSLGDRHGARDYYVKAERIAESMAAADPANRQAQFDHGIVLMRIGSVLEARGEEAASLDALSRSAGILEPLFAGETKNTSYAKQLALVYEYRGQRLYQLGDLDGAERSYRRSLEVLSILKPDDPGFARQKMADTRALGPLLARLGRREEALRLAQDALESAERFVKGRKGSELAYLPRALASYAATWENLGDRREAAVYYRRAVNAWSTLDPVMIARFSDEIKSARQALARAEKST